MDEIHISLFPQHPRLGKLRVTIRRGAYKMFHTGSMLSTWDGEGEVRLLSYLNSLLIVMMRLQGEEYLESGEWVHSQVHKNQNSNQRPWRRDFLGGPVVKNPPSNAGDTISSLVGELRSHIWGGNWALEPQLLSPHHNYWSLCVPEPVLLKEKPEPQLRRDAPK